MALADLNDRHEKAIATGLVRAALQLGWTVSVYDGGAWALCASDKQHAILNAMATTDCDNLRFRQHGEIVCAALLVYGNGEDLISDTSDNSSWDLLEQTFKNVTKGRY